MHVMYCHYNLYCCCISQCTYVCNTQCAVCVLVSTPDLFSTSCPIRTSVGTPVLTAMYVCMYIVCTQCTNAYTYLLWYSLDYTMNKKDTHVYVRTYVHKTD